VRPACPRCRGKTKQSFMADIPTDVAQGRAPGLIGGNIQNVAYDRAMEATMADQQLTNIQDHSRPGAVYRAGEPTAPQLPAHLQAQADAFWGGAKQPRQRTGKVDLSPVLGAGAAPPGAAQFQAEANAGIAPIMNHVRSRGSAIPEHTVIAGS
jgi:hypothetical protein